MAKLPKGQGVVPMPPFMAFLADNIPAVYDNTMSYYEELTALIKYLQDTVVPALNADSEAITVLSNFVEHYFDNLDVQEEINNKLDQMAEDGTLQEIITTYIQANVAWTFNTVADMKQATNLIAGSYAQTLGFYSLSDGGGATYYITDSGTANEMDIIAVGTLYANLVYGKEINVKQLGAYGDDVNDDYAIFTQAVTLAGDGGLLYVPKGTYKLASQLTAKGIDINCKGVLHNDYALIIGGTSSGSTKTNTYIYKANDIRIEGAKDCYFNLRIVNDITMYSDGDISNNTSQAYNIIDGIECNSFTINGVNNGWINENKINIKRCRTGITITGDDTYYHNNNRFNDISLEGSTDYITIDCGHDNFISYRGENDPVVTIANNTSNFGNVIVSQYESLYYRIYNDIDKNSTLNFVGNQALPNSKVVQILDVNTLSVKSLNSDQYINSDGLIGGNYKDEYITSNVDPTKPFTIIIKSDTASQRVFIKCFDENDEGIEANIRSTNISWNNTNKDYRLGSDTGRANITYYPTAGVERIRIKISSGTHAFRYATAYIACPFLNFDDFHNEVDTTKKYRSSAPTSSSIYSSVGDVIYNSSPSAGGTIGWVCVTAGNPGTWKAFGEIAE